MPTKSSSKKKTTAKPRRQKGSGSRPKASGKVDKVAEVPQRLRIRVRAYESKILDSSVKQIIDTALRFDSKVIGPVPLPTERRKYTVNRSSFVHKDAREQFEMRVHKRLIDIVEPSGKVVDALTNLSLPSGVNIEVKML